MKYLPEVPIMDSPMSGASILWKCTTWIEFFNKNGINVSLITKYKILKIKKLTVNSPDSIKEN